MDESVNWDLRHIFENDEALNNAKAELNNYIERLSESKGKLGENVDEFYKCYKNLEKCLELYEKIYAYAMLRYHQDMSNQDSIKMYKEAEMLGARFSEVESFITPETSSLPDERLEEYLCDYRIKEYEKTIRDVIKSKKHILSSEAEEILAKYQEVFSVSENAYDIFTDTEFDYPSIKDDNGNELKMDAALFSKYLKDPSENVRKQAFESMYSLYKRHINTITELYLGRVKAATITSKLRNYESSLDRATDHDDSNIAVYKTLVSEMDKALSLNHRYIALKARLMGKEKVNLYDVYVNTLSKEEENIDYEEAKREVLDALSVLGNDYTDKLREAFDNRWIDVYKKDNKRGGGYCMGVYGVHPYVLLNYINSSRDVSTIAHELGHAMHTFYSHSSQNVINANYTIMVAEVASTVNEILLANYQIERETDSRKKAELINEQLDMIRATLVRQTMFAEFEEKVHGIVEEGKSINAEEICDIYKELVTRYFGDSCIINEEIRYEWARIPHFYSPFYVYKYATGITSAIVIASNILAHKEGYIDRYKEMLSLGGSKDSLTLLKMVDVDLEKEETYRVAFKYFEDKLNELENLV